MRDPGPPMRPVRLPVLDPAECEDWVLLVSLQRRHWRRRHPEAPFYTLGQAAYLDARLGPGGYYDREERRRNNTLLRGQFLPLLELVAEVLDRHLGRTVRLAEEEAALPGFHIYLPHPVFAGPVAKRHRDLQYRQAFPRDTIAAGDLLTFTLPLSTPPGSGLALWDDPDGSPVHLPYADGELVVHDGMLEHRAELACDGELERITLQGHGIRRDGEFLLYW